MSERLEETTVPSLLTTLGIDRLPTTDRLQLVDEILDNLPDSEEPPLTDAQRQELDRRVADLDAGKSPLSPWAEVEARVLARLGR
jgi:putative addiction module component (TIGR02574 family)